ncbi:Kinesin-like protein kif15 [Podila epigama]|nr:Kinesin-like protein kif15 [Podila epigama]
MRLAAWSAPSEHVKVYVRVRPPNERELAAEPTYASQSSSQGSQPTVNVLPPNGTYKNDTFTYDCVGGESTTQDQVFNDVGKSIVEQCVRGYNGTIFAYGQTGSGKTYTMQGPTSISGVGNHPQRGIIPRCLEYLFELIANEERMDNSVKYLCKASYIEIYNEAIFDLLDSSASSRSIREDIKRGVYVDGVVEESIHNPEDAYKLFEQGALNRHTSATAMNAESSRSHTVLTLTIQSMALVDGINHIRESRFNLVDLAGSERQKLANTEGQRLKEAGNINKSLSCLGSVINALGEIAAGHPRYVHYRDSRLTFLLKDSLGGNSNTFIVANISPSALCYQESLSTLRFAQRAKMIKNKAVVNEDIQGNINELRAEIQRLKAELSLKRPGLEGAEDTSTTHKLLLETLARLRNEQAEHATTAQKAYQLDDACKAREKQVQQAQMVTKFKESALIAYRKGITGTAFEAEKSALLEEITYLKRQLDFHPELLKVKAENMSLREMLQKYEKYQAGLEEQEENLKKDKEYFFNLSEKLVEMEQENEMLRARLGAATPFAGDTSFGSIDDLMQESPPKSQEGYRRFSSDVKSLFQRVTKNRQAEYRRLSGNLAKPDQSLLDNGRIHSEGHITDDDGNKRASLASTQRSRLSSTWLDDVDMTPAGGNLSESISATMHSDDTVEMTLLKRDVDRLKDENSVLMEEKANLEKEMSDKDFQLVSMEKCLEQVTSQAEQYGREFQQRQAACAVLEATIQELHTKQKEDLALMENLQAASVEQEHKVAQHEQALEKVKQNLSETEQQLKNMAEELNVSRQRAADIQKEYDTQVEYNRKRVNEFQEKETQWDQSKAELVLAKELVEKELEQERIKSAGALADLQKSQALLQQEVEKLQVEKKALEELDVLAKKELAEQAVAHQGLSERFEAVSATLQELHKELETRKRDQEALQSKLEESKQETENMSRQYQEATLALASKDESSRDSVKRLEQTLEQREKELEEKRATEVESLLVKCREETETALEEARKSLMALHESELEEARNKAKEQDRRLAEARVSLQESVERAEKATLAKEKVNVELVEVRAAYSTLTQELAAHKQDKASVEKRLETVSSKCQTLEASLEAQKNELSKLNLSLQHERWEKEQLESSKRELREKVSEMARKIGETEQKLDQAREAQRAMETEHRTVQEELEEQLSKTRNDLAIKTSENQLNEEYKRKFRELRAQFADLGPAMTARQQQGFHERDLKRVMELEKMREELREVRIRSDQVEAKLSLAQELNEQLLEDAKAGTMKIAEEMEKRLQEVETQRQEAEKEVELALENVRKRTSEVQALEVEVMQQNEKIQTLEQAVESEKVKAERLEGLLAKTKQSLEDERQASEAGQATAAAAAADEAAEATAAMLAAQRLKKEELLAQRKLLLTMKEEQQALVRRQQLEQRDKTMALFEGLATENGKLLEQVRDLGMVNERMMKHQNSKQKLQYHVKIKQENNDLRIENQRLMFKTIELEERLGNKDNVESLRKQVMEMHGNLQDLQLPLSSSSEDLYVATNFGDDDSDVNDDDMKKEDAAGMECVKAEKDEVSVSVPRSNSGTPPASSSTGSTSPTRQPTEREPMDARSRSQTRSMPGSNSRKRTAAVSSSTAADAAGTRGQRKRFASVGPPSSASSANTGTKAAPMKPRASSVALPSSNIVIEIPLGPRARAKAAADAAFAASKVTGVRPRSATPGPSTTSNKSATTSRVTTTAGAKPRFQQLTQASMQRTTTTTSSASVTARGAKSATPLLHGTRSGGAITKPSASSLSSSMSSIRSGKNSTKVLEAVQEHKRDVKEQSVQEK